MTALSATIPSERDKLIAALIAACRCMTLLEIQLLLDQARQLNEIHCPGEGTMEQTV